MKKYLRLHQFWNDHWSWVFPADGRLENISEPETFSYHQLCASAYLTRWRRGRELVLCLYSENLWYGSVPSSCKPHSGVSSNVSLIRHCWNILLHRVVCLSIITHMVRIRAVGLVSGHYRICGVYLGVSWPPGLWHRFWPWHTRTRPVTCRFTSQLLRCYLVQPPVSLGSEGRREKL